eukprot:CAMPEP_0174923112 /NCGR_PEP_ID=MMETSP1355-20121228/6362_1 /TAXON_ID=464990 /ORGANISM="Hemiselmis tepida, Strain CCMP443" /LENGTH=329 /DNA_ID=CAMNT_0016168767 /DNA_START=178 /DNA_END=1164 /DNA_ORIENTATION=+
MPVSSYPAGRAAALALIIMAAVMMSPVEAWGPLASSVPVGSSFAPSFHKAVSHAPHRSSAAAPATSARATSNGGVQQAVMAAKNPNAIGVQIPAGFSEGADYTRDGKNLNPGDLVLITRSDGSVRIGEVAKKVGGLFSSQVEVIVEPSGATRAEEALNLGKPTPAGLAKLGIGSAPVVSVVKGAGNAPPPPKSAAPPAQKAGGGGFFGFGGGDAAKPAPPASAPPAKTPAAPAAPSPAEERKRQQEAKMAEQKRIQAERLAAQKAAQEERQRQAEERKRQQEEARAAAQAARQQPAPPAAQPPAPATQPPPPKQAAPPARQGSGGFFGL